MIHELKMQSQHFRHWKAGIKRCELRRSDRNFQVGDTLHLLEVVQDEALDEKGRPLIPVWSCTGKGLTTDVLGILRDHAGLAPDYVLLYCGEPTYDLP